MEKERVYKRIEAELLKDTEGKETGEVLAKFGTVGVIDLDGDVIEKGAIGSQAVKISAFGHTSWLGALPVGKGVTEEKDDDLLARMSFFMDTTHGADHFRTVKGLGELGEWSFGFDIMEQRQPTEEERQLGIRRVLKELDVFEVSPVLRGAGVDTQTLDAKCEACAVKTKEIVDDPCRKAKDALEAGEEEELEVEEPVVDDPETKALEEGKIELGRARLLLEKVDRRRSA